MYMNVLLKTPIDKPDWSKRLLSLLSIDTVVCNSKESIAEALKSKDLSLNVYIIAPMIENRYRGMASLIADVLSVPNDTLVISLIRNRSNAFKSGHLSSLGFLTRFAQNNKVAVVYSLADAAEFISIYRSSKKALQNPQSGLPL